MIILARKVDRGENKFEAGKKGDRTPDRAEISCATEATICGQKSIIFPHLEVSNVVCQLYLFLLKFIVSLTMEYSTNFF